MEIKVKSNTFSSIEEYENSYLFKASISGRRNIEGKTYLVKRYFGGNTDFETVMKKLATQQTNKIAR